MRREKTYFVYIMSNRSKTLYTGVTENLIRRVREHKKGTGASFTSKYKLDRLVYFERFSDIRNAIEREKTDHVFLRRLPIAFLELPMIARRENQRHPLLLLKRNFEHEVQVHVHETGHILRPFHVAAHPEDSVGGAA